MSKISAEPLCSECDRPTIVLWLEKPRGRKRDTEEMLPRPDRNKDVIKKLEDRTRNLVSLVCHRNDMARFEHEEWLLAGDGDVSWHEYALVRDCIYVVIRMEV